jgi:hypothetical protein
MPVSSPGGSVEDRIGSEDGVCSQHATFAEKLSRMLRAIS